MSDSSSAELFARKEARAFGPVAFWASLLSFVVAMIHSFLVICYPSEASQLNYLTAITMAFFYIYVLRIYCGILFLSYDESIGAVIERSGIWKRRTYVGLQFFELSLCLCVPTLFYIFSVRGGYIFLTLESALLVVFWVVFIKDFFEKDKDRRSNIITLFLDVAAAIPAILYWTQIIDDGAIIGILATAVFFYAVFFLFEFIFVYVQSWRSFLKMTKLVIGRSA
jgi:hypothetical protein